MSEENVEIVRQGFEAYVRGDLSAALASFDADIVFNPAEEAPIQGRDAVLAYIQRWEEPWEDYEGEAEEFIDAGDRVVVTLHFKGRGRGSGIEVEARFHQVHTLREEKTVRMDEYTDREEALKAAGLRE
jgi:ketosteroid isomerase-like protein